MMRVADEIDKDTEIAEETVTAVHLSPSVVQSDGIGEEMNRLFKH